MSMPQMAFVRFVDWGTHFAAEFELTLPPIPYGQARPLAFDRPNLETRVANLRKLGVDTSVEDAVLTAWPWNDPRWNRAEEDGR